MALFIVMQRPKVKRRNVLFTTVQFVEAENRKAAIASATTNQPDLFSDAPAAREDCLAVTAELVRAGNAYKF